MISPSGQIRIGVEKPNSRILVAISPTCAGLGTRALCAEGTHRSIGHVSSFSRSYDGNAFSCIWSSFALGTLKPTRTQLGLRSDPPPPPLGLFLLISQFCVRRPEA